MLFSNPKVLPALLLCIGLGLILVRGQELQTIQAWTPEDIETAVELNLALDLARRAESTPLSESEKAARKAAIREEIQKTFVEPQEKIRTEYRQGFWIAGAGLVLMILVVVLQQRGIIKK